MAYFLRLNEVHPGPESARVGRVRISLNLLASVLFPEGTTIVEAYQPHSIVLNREELELVVTHSSLEELEEGNQIPLYEPSFSANWREDGSVTLRTIEFESWGVGR